MSPRCQVALRVEKLCNAINIHCRDLNQLLPDGLPSEEETKGQQLTLFGGVLVGSAIHKGRNLYEKFVNSFVARYSDQSVARADVVYSAQAKTIDC